MENKQMSIQEIVESEGWKIFTKKIELVCIVALATTIILFLAKNHWYNATLTLGGSTLIVIYFFFAYKPFQSKSKLLAFFFFKVYGFGLAFSWTFILFSFKQWPYPKTEFFFVSLITTLASLLLGIRLNNQEEHPEIDKFYFIRLLVTLGLIVFVYVKFIQ